MKNLLLTTLAVVAVGGCSGAQGGPRTMRVWGDVTFEGKPIDDGTIDFVSTDGSPPAQGQIKAGHYDVPADAGPVAEKTYKVQITSLVKAGKPLMNVMGDGEATMQPMANTIPPEYNLQSKLTVEISKDSSSNQFDFQLEGKPLQPR